MIIDLKTLNILKISNYLINKNLINIIYIYWKIFYYLLWWNNKNIFQSSNRVMLIKYQSNLNFIKYFTYYFRNYFFFKIFLNLNDNSDYYLYWFLKKNYYNNKYVKNWNELKLLDDKKKDSYLDLTLFDEIIIFENNYNFYYNFYPYIYLN